LYSINIDPPRFENKQELHAPKPPVVTVPATVEVAPDGKTKTVDLGPPTKKPTKKPSATLVVNKAPKGL
jgi:hypothetical protein